MQLQIPIILKQQQQNTKKKIFNFPSHITYLKVKAKQYTHAAITFIFPTIVREKRIVQYHLIEAPMQRE